MKQLIFYKLSKEFFQNKQEMKFDEILEKENRPYLDGTVISDNSHNYFVPMRTNINSEMKKLHPELYIDLSTKDKPFAGLDLTKIVIIANNDLEKFVGVKAGIQNQQYNKLMKELPALDQKLQNFISDYRQHPNREKYKFSALQYFHKELGIEKSQQVIYTQEVTHKPTQQISKKHSSRSTRITDEMKKQAKNTSILDYVKYYGIPVRRTSGSEYELVEQKNVKFDIRKNLFKDYNPSSNAGGDMIDFAKYIDGLNFPKAIQKIGAVDGSGTYDFSSIQSEPFVMPQIFEEDNRLNEAMIYLVNERKFESSTIKKMAANGLIKQTKNKEVAFIWADGPEDVGVTLQGTKPLDYRSDIKETGLGDFIKEYTWKVGIGAKGLERPLETGKAETKSLAEEAVQTFLEEQRPYKKQIWRNSTTGHGFNFRSGPTDSEAKGKIVFSEAAIDAISYFELKGQEFDEKTRVHYQSLEGLKDNIFYKSIERYEKRYSKLPGEIILAVDNDAAGDAFVKKILSDQRVKDYQAKGVKFKRETANFGKDWNEHLQHIKSESRSYKPNKEVQRGAQF